MDPTKVFSNAEEKAAFDSWLRQQLEAGSPMPAEDKAELDGLSKEQLIAMLPEELQHVLFPPKGWHRSTARERKMRERVMQEQRYVFKNTGNKSFARKIP